VNVREVHSFREALSQKTVGVVVGTPLPGTLWITEVDLDVAVQVKALVISHLLFVVAGARLSNYMQIEVEPFPLVD